MRRSTGYAGAMLLALLWVAPLETWAAFPVHMLRHMGLVAVAAPLLVIGFPALGRIFAISALFGTLFEFVMVWAWHLPAAHAFARLSPVGFIAEQAIFLTAGLLVWGGALHGASAFAGAGSLLLTSMHMTLLGALLILAPRDLYARICGVAPDLGAKQLGGLLMLGIGAPIYLVAGLALVRRMLGEENSVT